MSYRFTNTEKWTDSWFSNLKQIEMLLFIYLCDNCDIAGFIEINYKRWANDLGSNVSTIEGACIGLQRGLIFSQDNDCLFIKNYLKHQKNLPINENNKAHVGILKRFEVYKYKFDIQDVNEFITRGFKGASKGLQSPTGIGNGIGIGNGNGKEEKSEFLFFHNSEEFTKTWNILIKEPNWKKKSQNALQLSLDKLNRVDEQTAIEMMKNTIAFNWKGIFPLKEQINEKPLSKTAQTLETGMRVTEEFVKNMQHE